MSAGNLQTKEFDAVLNRAMNIAVNYQHSMLTTEILMLSVLLEPAALECLSDTGVTTTSLIKDLQEYVKDTADGDPIDDVPVPTENIRNITKRAVATALFNGSARIDTLDLLMSIVEHIDEDDMTYYLLHLYGFDKLKLQQSVIEYRDLHPTKPVEEDEQNPFIFRIDLTNGMDDEDISLRGKPVDNSKSKAEQILEKHCTNLNDMAKAGKIDRLIGREHEVEMLILTSARRQKNNTILVGEPGVGKTAIAEGFARMIVEGQVPDALENAIVYSLEIGTLLAGTKFRGEMEGRIKQILEALEQVGEEKGILPFIFIDEMHTMMGAGSGGSQGAPDVAQLLKPALSKGRIRCIGGTTFEEYRKHFEKDRALVRRFHKLDVMEPSPEHAKEILKGMKEVYEACHGVTYDDDALDAAVDLTVRYVTDRQLPDKAIDIIDLLGARQKVAGDDAPKNITVQMVEDEVARVAKIASSNVSENDTDKLGRLEADLRNAVFGQDAAIDAVVDCVFLSRAGLRDPNKPHGNFLFAGPTGVGKTELSKQLASTMDIPIHRFDMSEYMEQHSVSKFIGSPPGYVGYGDGAAGSGLLVNAIEQDPYSVLLIDEIEKAHPDVLNIFLQIMDNGEFKSSSGKAVNCRNLIVIMTTNAGAADLQKNSIGFGDQSSKGKDDVAINNFFSPEFRNRLDAIVKFNALETSNMISIVEKMLKGLEALAAEKEVTLDVSDAAKEYLADKGYDKLMGARPMARLIQDKVARPLSRHILFGDLKNGGKVVVDLVDNDITVAIAESVEV